MNKLPTPASSSRGRRRPDLTLPMPQRDMSKAVPLPLPPKPNATSGEQASPVTFSDLEKINRIGSGAGGTVYKVVHKNTRRVYALKVIYGNHDDSVRNQICREIEILRDVDNPNVVKCHTMFDHAGEIQIGSGAGMKVYKVVHKNTGWGYALNVIYRNHDDSVRNQICREIEILRDVDNPNVVKCHTMFDHAGDIQVIYGNHDESVRKQICQEIEILRDVGNHNVVKCHTMFDHALLARSRRGNCYVLASIEVFGLTKMGSLGVYNPNVEKCFTMFDLAARIKVLLEYMDGGSLEGQAIRQEPSLADLTKQILSGLFYLHRRKIVHRDIKPSNLLVNSKKQVKIADFGVSRILSQTMDPCNSAVGTIAYMSPERINTDLNHGKYDGYAGDIWSLGVSILEFYLGKFPFAVGRQGEWASLMCAICMSQPPEAPPTASAAFRDFISCCLQRDPAKRWTAGQLLHHPFILQNTTPSGAATQLHQLLPPPRPLSNS